jgi:hypothetical protein
MQEENQTLADNTCMEVQASFGLILLVEKVYHFEFQLGV